MTSKRCAPAAQHFAFQLALDSLEQVWLCENPGGEAFDRLLARAHTKLRQGVRFVTEGIAEALINQSKAGIVPTDIHIERCATTVKDPGLGIS